MEKENARNLWCGGWDLNPRRPTPEDLKSKIDYFTVKKDFIAWLQSRGLNWENHVRQLIQHLEKYFKPIEKPMDLITTFNGLSNSQRRHLKNGLRLLFNFYEAQGLVNKHFLDILRKNLPKTSIGVDLRVPTENEIVSSIEALNRSLDVFSVSYRDH